MLRCRGLVSASSIHGDLIFGNSVNEVKGFSDKAREASKGSMPFKMPAGAKPFEKLEEDAIISNLGKLIPKEADEINRIFI